tara:strand:- start:3575 stop:4450 length:876 start_codon:yes stop_codon:yes gene_type:complete
MALKDLRSNLDIHGGNQAISQGGNPGGFLSNAQPPFDGGANLATGPLVGEQNNDYDFYRDSGNLDSPFEYPSEGNGYPTADDHLVAMLERRNVSSTNGDPLGPLGSSMVTNPMTYSPAPGGNGQGTLDQNMNMNGGVNSLNNTQYGNGLFGDALGQGKTVDGEDLHVHMLQNQYTSNNTSANYNGTNYGAGQPNSSYPALNPGELDLNTTTGGIGNAPGFAKYRNPFTNPSVEPSPNEIDTVSEQGLEGLYNSSVNPNTNYNGNWPSPSRLTPDLDINGATPSKYIDSLPQ